MFPLKTILKKSNEKPNEENNSAHRDIQELKREVYSLQLMVKQQNLMIDELIKLYKALDLQYQREEKSRLIMHRCYLCYSREVLSHHENQRKATCLVCKQFYDHELSMDHRVNDSYV
jgi:hypothetical protein